jgi:hypothetical protein
MTTTKALILPADTPPRRTSIKRQLLFFDSLLLIDPVSDFAILNAGEISETFPDGRGLQWGEYGSYSRSSDYVEAYRVLFAETSRLQNQGKIRILKAALPSVMDPKFNWIASVAASRDEALVRAALPDYRSGTEAYYRKYGGWYVAAIPTLANQESVHTWMLGTNHYEMPNIDIEWNQVGWVRLGRALKSLRRAGVESAVPLALDSVNQNICVALGARAYRQMPSVSDLAAQVIALDVVDPLRLDEALVDMTWDNVVRLRKEVLPHAAKLRKLLEDSVIAARKPQNADVEVYSRALAELKEKHKRATNELHDAWRKLGFNTLNAGVAAASGGLSTLVPPGGWAPVLLGIAGAFVASMAKGTAADLHKVIVASKARKVTPLLFFDVLPEKAEKIVREQAASEESPRPRTLPE